MNKLTAIRYRMISKVREYRISKIGSAKRYSDSISKYAGHTILSSNDANKYIYDNLMNNKPFLAGRFGSTELLNIRSFDFGGFIGQKYDRAFHFNHLCEWSGFFPNDIKLLPRFVDEMKTACKELDFLAVWFQPFEDYYIKKIMKPELKISYLLDFEPWADDFHWSAALEGKKVLVIHPFENTIRNQYRNRDLLFPNTDILPKFELKTLRAVQTLAGTVDPRFSTWFDALEWMYEEAMKIDFNIAIVGCGAYGLPLAARLKQSGKQAIHLAGATQLLFGIKGKRWEANEAFAYVREWFNESWIWIGFFCIICLYNLLNPFITIWLGENYLFPQSTVLVIVVSFYIQVTMRTGEMFKSASGLFWNDRYAPVAQCLINIVLSIALAQKYEITGIFIGTSVSMLLTKWWITPYVLFKHKFQLPLRRYFLKYGAFTGIGGFAFFATTFCIDFIHSTSIAFFSLKMLICVLLPNVIFLLCLFKTKEFQYCLDLLAKGPLKKYIRKMQQKENKLK